MTHKPPSGFRPKQSLGQNFLVDENIVRNIVRDMHTEADDVVLEIGPGTGALTGHLLNRVGHLVVVEIDGRVIDGLRERFPSDRITILHEDFLTTDIAGIRKTMNKPLRIAGNLPYHLTSPILFRLFEFASCIRDVTIMVQREVARRIVSPPGSKEYGILSVMTRFHGEAKMLFDVSPACFYPKPRVISTVLQFSFREGGAFLRNIDPALFSTVVRTTFGKRRKTLRNSLRYLPFDEAFIDTLLGHIKFPLEKRPEELSLEDFAELTRIIGARISTR
jgi:16S rRNA (adenine1518-N6/adenine1519-N6)-dimethyltransferase